MKSAEEILEKDFRLSPEDISHYKIWDEVLKAMKAYAEQAIDRCSDLNEVTQAQNRTKLKSQSRVKINAPYF